MKIRLGLQQHFSYMSMRSPCSIHERCSAEIVSGIDVGSFGQEEFYHLGIASKGGFRKSSPAVMISGFNICPDFEEQIAIEGQLKVLDGSLNAEENEKVKLQKLKSGLMTDLLTGRVRDPDDTRAAGAPRASGTDPGRHSHAYRAARDARGHDEQ